MLFRSNRGGKTANGPRAVANGANVVISSITEDDGAREIFTGSDGFLAGDVTGKLFIEMSTLRPMTHRELAPLVQAKGGALIDSPVMGSTPHVKDGQLLALVGGAAADVERARPVLEKLARRIVHLGPNGAGCAMKLAVNLGMAVYLQSLAESFAMGEAEGLNVAQMLDVFADSPTASPFLKGKMSVLKGEAGGVSLDMRTLRKDVMSAMATGAVGGVPMPAGSGALATLSAAVAGGWGDRDLAELPRWFREFMPQRFD